MPEPSALRNGLGLYPRTFTFGDDVIVTGPPKALTATLDTATFTWDESLQTMSRSRIAGNAVRRPGEPGGSDTVTTLGGFDRNLGTGPFYPATETSETIDARATPATWQADAPLNVARANGNTVLLPDGSMVEVGGGSGFQEGGDPDGGAHGGYVTYADGRARQIEVFDPDSEQMAARAGAAGGPHLSLDRGPAPRRQGVLGGRRSQPARIGRGLQHRRQR